MSDRTKSFLPGFWDTAALCALMFASTLNLVSRENTSLLAILYATMIPFSFGRCKFAWACGASTAGLIGFFCYFLHS